MKIITALMVILFIKSCSNSTESSSQNSKLTEQQKVFNEFWSIYDRYYPLMHRKNIDWKKVYYDNFLKVGKKTNDQQLFKILTDIMQNVIKDGHCDIVLNGQSASYQPEENIRIQRMIRENTAEKISFISNRSNPYLSYGVLKNNRDIGYIASKRFEPVNMNDNEFNNFKSIVDLALNDLKDKKAIIIDIRTNGGGQGPYAFYFAGRFFETESETIIRQRVKLKTGSTESSLSPWLTKNTDGFPDPRAAEGGRVAAVFVDEQNVKKSGNFQFVKKVFILSSRSTASAAEHFIVAMKTQSHVKSIGNTSFGIFAGSDIFTLKSGNRKWKTRLSVFDVEVKYNGKYQSFEGLGIPPDQLLLPTDSDLSSGKDIHIDAAVSFIIE